MRAAVFHEFGDPSVVRIEEVPDPRPAAGEALVEVHAAGLNHLDLWVRRGLPIETTMPHIGGAEVAGVVTELGEGVREVAVGDRVVADPSLSCGECAACRAGEEPLCESYRILGEHVQGGFAERVTVPARNLLKLPSGFPFDRAAASPLVFGTAWRGLMTRGRLREGASVLVTGASGGVATVAIRIARWVGARVFALTSTPHLERVRALGADVVYDRTDADWSRQLWRETGKRGVDVVFDSVGEAIWEDAVRSLAPGGRLVTYGATTGARASMDIRRVFWRQLEILGTTMASRREFAEVMGLVLTGALVPVIADVMPLERAREAHERLEAGDVFGKLILAPR